MKEVKGWSRVDGKVLQSKGWNATVFTLSVG